jgi:hypothetical protein
MTKTRLFLVALAGVILTAGYSARDDLAPLAQRTLSGEGSHFAPVSMPSDNIAQIYDMGVVDANGDSRLDIYTSNHNYRQVLWLADRQGAYQDALSAWGLDQSHAFPGAEQSMDPPVLSRPGFYVYWQGDTLHLRAHDINGPAPLKGTIAIYRTAEVTLNEGFSLKNTTEEGSSNAVPKSHLGFAVEGNGHLALYMSTRGTPVAFHLDAPWAQSKVYVGSQQVTPPSPSFELTLQDRHGMAWADYNDDGLADVFITRGALGGTLRKFPEKIRAQVSDEMLVSSRTGRFTEQSSALGVHKQDCSGRHVRWVDFNHDGLLDLHINCQDRGHVAGGYPKQLYRQDVDKRLVEVAAEVGLDVPDHQLVDFAWLDVDRDGDVDLLTHEDQGFFVYLQEAGRFKRATLQRGTFERVDIKGLKGNTDDYWQFDGKLSLTDFDGDGDLDVFSASKKGNTFLVNEGGGRFRLVDPVSAGLPKVSVAATWVDYDNDGRPDLHTVPEGLFHQSADHRFTATGCFSLSKNKYQAAFIHWFDQDNDGKPDLLMALQENASLWRWWEKPFKSVDVKGKDDRFQWKLLAYRNVGARGHWLQVQLRGGPGNREGIGARITVVTPNGQQAREVGSNESSYFSQGHYRQYFGLGEQARIDRIEVRWPDGPLQRVDNVKPDQLLTVARDANR